MKKEHLAPAGVLVGTLTVLALSAWVHWPWLYAENSRLDPFSRVLVWSSDAYVLLLMAWLVARHYVCVGLLRREATPGRPVLRSLLAGMILAWGVDLVVTLYTAYEESAGYARAEQAAGVVVDGRPSRGGQVGYLACRFCDRAGQWHESYHQVSLSDMPAPTVQAIQAGRFPLAVRIDYDPRWPGRCWIDGFDNAEENRIHWMSASCLLFQAILVPAALVCGLWFMSAGSVPLYPLIPFWSEMVPFVLAAGAKFAIGEF